MAIQSGTQTVLFKSTIAAPTVFVEVGGIKEVKESRQSVTAIDVTTTTDTDKKFIPGHIRDNGNVECTILYDRLLANNSILETTFRDRLIVGWRVYDKKDGSYVQFLGFIEEFQIQHEVEESIMADISIKITGGLTRGVITP